MAPLAHLACPCRQPSLALSRKGMRLAVVDRTTCSAARQFLEGVRASRCRRKYMGRR